MKLPTPDDQFLRETFRILERMDNNNFKKNQDLEIGQNRIILMSPNGTRYALVVSNTGALSTVVV